MDITRNHTGHRCGASHQRAKISDDVVVAARKWRDHGMSYRKIASAITGRYGIDVSMWTIRDWVDLRTRTNV